MGCAREYGREVLLGPLTEGLDVPRDLDLDLDFGDRARALDRLHALTTPLAARPAPPRRPLETRRRSGRGFGVGSGRWGVSQCRQVGRTWSSSVRSTGVPSTGAGSSAVGSIPPAAVLSSVARPSGSTVPNTV